MTFTHTPFNTYHVTGLDRTGKRFSLRTRNPVHFLGINVWRGTKWIHDDRTGKRTMVEKIGY